MINTHLYLDKRTIKEGKVQVKLYISFRQSSTLIPLDIWIKPEHWDDQKKLVKTAPDKAMLNSLLAQSKLRIDQVILQLSVDGGLKGCKPSDVRKKVLEVINPDEVRMLFSTYYIQYMERREARRTYEIYEATLKWMRKFDKKFDSLTFDQINKRWLDGFDDFLKPTSPSKNARNIHLRNIRAVFNDALDAEVTSCYPFRKVKIRPESTIKRNLSREQLLAIFDAEVDAFRQKYIDLFKLMFLLIGINIGDLCELTPLSIQGDRLVYRRMKTGRIYNIKIEPEAMELLKKYPGKKKLLDVSEGCNDYRHFSARLNKNLKTVMPGITTYYARHSWATIASSLDIPKETISAALGHGGNSVTDIYIEFDKKKVDEANRKVIDWVLYGKM